MQTTSPAEPGLPPRPLFRIVFLALTARLLRDLVSYELAVLALGGSLGLLLLALAKRKQMAASLIAHALLLFAILMALLGPKPERSDGLSQFDGWNLSETGVAEIELAEPRSCEVGDRIRVEAGSATSSSARGPVSITRTPPTTTRLVLPDECVRVAVDDSDLERAATGLKKELEQLRARCMGRARDLREPETRALVRSLVFGDTSSLDFELRDLFTRTGTRHLLAVSGLHVSLVLLLLIGPCSGLLILLLPNRIQPRARDLARDSVRLLALAALVYLAGARAPVLRAAAAFAFLRAGSHLPRRFSRDRGSELGVTRRADALSVWSLALSCECLAAGSDTLSLSVRLSYGATLGLLLGTAPITKLLRRWLRIDDGISVHKARGAWLRVPARKLRDSMIRGVGASIAATAVTLPFVWQEFGEWSPIGVVATPLVLPLFTLVLFLSWSWIALPLNVTEVALDSSIELLISVLRVMDQVPSSPLLLPARPSLWLVAWSLPFLCALLPHFGTRLRRNALRVSAFALGCGLLPWAPEPETAELHLLDVGHGTAACLRVPGEACWIFDAGSRDRARVARDALLPLLAAWEVPRVRVVLSHGDRDHSSALRTLVTRLPIELWAGAPPEPSGVRLARDVPRMDLESGRMQLPTSRASGLALELSRWRDLEGNEGSRSLHIQIGETRVLLTGDAEGEALRELAKGLAEEEPVSLMLLPHHGSDGPHFGRLLREARPGEVWISHSRALSIAGELDRRGITWKSTARDGPLALEID